MGVEIRVMFKSSQADGATLRLPANRQAHERLATIPYGLERQSTVLQGKLRAQRGAIDAHADWWHDDVCVWVTGWEGSEYRSQPRSGTSRGACYPSCVLPEPDVDKVAVSLCHE